MKILHVVTSLEPGGMENGVVNVAAVLESRGHEIHVACLERSGPFANRLPALERVTVLGKGDGFSRSVAWRMARLLGTLRPDLVHSHNLGPLIYSGLAMLGGCRTKLVHGEHAHLTVEELTPRRLRQRRWLYRACRAVHTVSNPMREELVALGLPPGKIETITNGVDTARFAPGDRTSARAALGIPSDATVISIVGRFGSSKGHGVLLDAFRRLAPGHPRLNLLIVGTGGSEEKRIVERIANDPNRSRIHCLGFQSEPAICYQALDLLILPSTNEGMSNAALESMSCSVPVLGNTGCGHEEFISTGVDGFVADLTTADSVASRLESLLAAPERLPSIGAVARQKITTSFSLTKMADAYERFYRKASA